MAEICGRRERRITHYSSAQSILLVGEGDFSFSCSLAMAFGLATNIVATSFDTYERLMEKYKSAYANIAVLEIMGATVLHGVDATQMRTFPDLRLRKFDRIIYNFPHAGFHGKEDNPELIGMHRNLVRGFLMNASTMLRFDGEIHVNHKIKAPFDSWRIEDLAVECSLLCISLDDFRIEDYPGYQNKRGSGPRSDEPFPLGECRTFKFKLYPRVDGNLSNGPTFRPDCSNECYWIFGRYLDHVEDTFGRLSYDDARRSVHDALRVGYNTYMGSGQGRNLRGYIEILEELRRLSILRSERLRQRLLGLDRMY
ncbi:uncharacterized protein at4g26485 [Phtheirospermum japonicum]|uniref:Uncharacterized protein at4g26485 n=1 Tax=Phtheirospermum japonicum TaxID=374723 RepID=A0A830C460_9LAMI|nr:uncharacterized protein at4g26485 [Phtheirospermum japonicum]